MKKKFVIACMFVSVLASAQYRNRDSNMIGIIAGMDQFDLNTSNFTTKAGNGYHFGASIRGNFYNDFDMVFAFQYGEKQFSVPTHTLALQQKEVDYKIPGVEVSLMLSYKIVENHLSVEVGPVLSVTDKFHIKKDDALNTIDGTNLTAGQITNVGKFNFYPAVGVTAGIRNLRANLQYQYGLTNALGGLDENTLGMKLKAHPSILSLNLLIYF